MRVFTVINENFICDYCECEVLALQTGCRNHCPNCLSSKHLDTNPGDRSNSCEGKMEAFSYSRHKKGLRLHFRCKKCQKVGSNVAALDDPYQPDNYDKILKLSSVSPIDY